MLIFYWMFLLVEQNKFLEVFTILTISTYFEFIYRRTFVQLARQSNAFIHGNTCTFHFLTVFIIKCHLDLSLAFLNSLKCLRQGQVSGVGCFCFM